MKLVRLSMGFDSGSQEKKQFRGKVNYALICKNNSELTNICNLLEAKNWTCDFIEEWYDGRPSITFMFDAADIEYFIDDYKEAKKSLK